MANKLMDRILKTSPTKYASVLSESAMFNNKDIIPTDIPIVNVAFSGDVHGGITSGLTLFAGPSKSFKSNLALVCVKAYLAKYKDSVCVLYDSEGGMNPEYLESQGVDSSRVVHIPIEHLEMLKFDIVKQLQEANRGDKIIFVIDSIGNTASLKELEDAQNEKSVAEMQRAKSLKGLFRMVTPSLVNKDIPCIAICHTYSTMETYAKQIISGGCVVEGTKVQMADGTLKNIEDINVGDYVRTLSGESEVKITWCPETLDEGTPECLSITFDDGYNVIVSETHKFLVSIEDKFEWIEAKDLTSEMDIIQL